MSNKVKRKVTVENSKTGDDKPRKPSVFERLGPNAVSVTAQPSDRHNRPEQNEKCRNWLRLGACIYGDTCRFKHDPFLQSSGRRTAKPQKDMDEKDLRHRVRTKRDDPKGSRTGSLSPKRTGKRSNSRSRKGEHESKIKSTVVVTRPRSPAAPPAEPTESKKKSEGNWEDDSDDWPMDAAQLDFKEELTLERKRQQLQRELALELQKERLLNENVTITKTVSFSESSSTSSSSDSGSISSSSGSSSSSSEDDSDDSSSSSSSSSSSGSRPPAKRRSKKSAKDVDKSSKGKDDYDKIKSSRAKMQKMRSPSPLAEGRTSKKKDKRKESSLSPRRRLQDSRNVSDGRANLNVRVRGPRTPSPVTTSRKQRQWAQSSSTDSRSADVQRNRGKRHKKKRDASRIDKRKSERVPSPPPLSSPNRTALMPSIPSSKKSKQRDESGSKSRHRGREPSPLLSRNSAANSSSIKLLGNSQRYLSEEKVSDKHRGDDRSKFYSKKDGDDMLEIHKRTDSHDRSNKRNRISPRKDSRRSSLSPPLKDRYDSEMMPGMKKLYPQTSHKDDKGDHRRQASDSPVRGDRRKLISDVDKKRDVRELSPRLHESRRDNQYRNSDSHFDKRSDTKGKRVLSPDSKKGRDDRNRDYNPKDRNVEYDTGSWAGEHRKTSSTGRRTPEPRGRQELRSQPSSTQGDRSRDRDLDRKKRKERDLSARSEDSDRNRLTSPRRSQSPIHAHLAVREIEPLTGNRGRIYDPDVPAGEREYAYGYDSVHDPYLNDRLLPADYEPDVIRSSSLYPPDVYPEPRYRRDGKDSGALIDRYGGRDVLSPHEILPHRDIISLTARSDDYIADIPIEERVYEERWSRGRGRDDWDTYGSIPPAPLPPHVAAALDEDRYGMPRRRRASPEWQRGRLDDRDSSLGGHRQLGRGQLPQEGRSRSPPTKKSGGNRAAWGDRGARHDTRNENRVEDSQKGLDDRKNRNIRKDRGKRKEELDTKPANPPKEKAIKRPHSPSPPPKDVKRRREDTGTAENVILSEKALTYKRLNEELKGDKKPFNRPKKVKKGPGLSIRELTKYKIDTASPRSDHSSPHPVEKGDAAKTAEVKGKDDRKPKHDSKPGDDDFSDWSDGDDDLLNRDDYVDSESTNDNSRMRHKSGEKMSEDSGSKCKDKSLKEMPQMKRIKESRSRTTSRDRSNDDASQKDSKLPVNGKDGDVHETASLKDDTATDVDEYITAESVDYDPISDDELDALIEEPEETLLKPQVESEKSKIVDALDVDWSALMSETKTDFKPGCARKRFTAAHVLSRIGFSQVFAGPELSDKIIKKCQEQLNRENDENEGVSSDQPKNSEEKKFVMEHQIAAFHVAISQTKKERIEVFSQVGTYRRALCARRDLQLRNLLCKPVNKLSPTATVSYSAHYSVGDKDLYKQSLEFLKKNLPSEIQPKTINVSAC